MSPPSASPHLQLISMLIHLGSSKPQMCDSKQSSLVTFLSNLKHRFLFVCHEHMWASLPDDYNPKVELAFMSDGRVIWCYHLLRTFHRYLEPVLPPDPVDNREDTQGQDVNVRSEEIWEALQQETHDIQTRHLPPSTWGDSIKESSERESPKDTILRFWESKRNVIIGFISI